jgi:hypothetical protein
MGRIFAAPEALIMPIARYAVPFAGLECDANVLHRMSATLSAGPFALNGRRAACVKVLHADANATRRPTPG